MHALLYLSLGVLALAGGYRLLWRRRYGPTGIEGHYMRLIGRVVGPGERGRVVYRQDGRGDAVHAEPFDLETPDCQRRQVDPSGSQVALHGGAIRVGDAVVVDATHGALHVDEALYRDSAMRPVLSALRLVRGVWPELRWLNVALVPAGLAAVALALTMPIPRWDPLQQTRLDCPAGTRAGGARGKIQWCEEDRSKETVVVGGQDAVKHGPWTVWWDRARVRQYGWFEAGRPSGLWTTLHRNGRLAVEGQYLRGQRVGLWRIWRADGTPIERGHYDGKGRRHGVWRNYFPGGRLALVREYLHGKRHGAWKRWNAAGRLVLLEPFEGGQLHGTVHRWNDDGGLVERSSYRRGQKHGIVARWYASGPLVLRGAYLDGKPHGLWTSWHPSGRIAAAGSYVAGEKEGRWTRWDPDGQLACRASYRDGHRQRVLAGKGCDVPTIDALAVVDR